MIKIHVAHYYKGPITYKWVDGQMEDESPLYVDNLEKLLTDYGGAVILKPPAVTGTDYWFMWITDASNRFTQK